MENLRHIHEVLEMIFTSKSMFTTTELEQKLHSYYGEDVFFTSCADHIFRIDGVVPFLLDKGKITLDGNKIIPVTQACNH